MLLSALTVSAQQPDRSNRYLADFDYLMENLIATHPDPFTAFGGTIGFYQEKQKTREEIKSIHSNDQFVLVLNKFLSKLEDGHTFINLPKTSKNDTFKHLPVRLKVASDQLFIQNTNEAFKSTIGKPIVAINDIPIDSVLASVKLYYPTENISGSYFYLIYLLRNKNSCNKFFGDSSNYVTFTLKDQAENYRVKFPYEEKTEWLEPKSTVRLPHENGWINWAIIGPENKIAYFQWNSIVSREYLQQLNRDNPQNMEGSLKWIYSGALKKQRTGDVIKDIAQVPALYEQFYLLLKEMQDKGSEYLIIDLRNNSGGMTPLTKSLLYTLYGDKYINFDFDATYSIKLSPLFLKKFGITMEQYNKGNNTDLVTGDFNTYPFGNLQGDSYANKVSQVANGYRGFGGEFIKKALELKMHPQIIVLTSINTFSAAYHFAYFLKKLGKATIVGVAPRQAGNSFMQGTQIVLPNTHITGSISNSIQILFKKDKQTGKLLHPDFEMDWNEFKKFNFDKESEVLKSIELIENKKINTR